MRGVWRTYDGERGLVPCCSMHEDERRFHARGAAYAVQMPHVSYVLRHPVRAVRSRGPEPSRQSETARRGHVQPVPQVVRDPTRTARARATGAQRVPRSAQAEGEACRVPVQPVREGVPAKGGAYLSSSVLPQGRSE